MTTIGPLTGDEWASFALIDGVDERNPLPTCCAELSEVRDAIFGILRAGGDPRIVWRRLASVWHVVEEHGDTGSHPTMRKLYKAYVAGRVRPDRADGFAHLLARDPLDVLKLIEAIPRVFDVGARVDRIRALARLGLFVGYILDPDQRDDVALDLAEQLHMTYRDVCLTIDVLRVHNNLPYEATAAVLRNPKG